jgi:hypothetical protein
VSRDEANDEFRSVNDVLYGKVNVVRPFEPWIVNRSAFGLDSLPNAGT